jgi:hypothetical protein
MKKLLAALAFLLAPVLAHADLINGGFETGNFTGWQTIGDALVIDSSIGTAPAGGTYQALVTNAPSRPSSERHFQSYSGNNSVLAVCPALLNDPLDTFLALPRCSLTQLATAISPLMLPSIVTWEGSAIKQTFTGNAGEILSFSWDFLTDEGVPMDFAFVVLDGTLSLLADFSTVSSGSGTPFRNESGYHIFATILPTNGTHYIGIGVVDTFLDQDINSGVLVDKFLVTKIPEPAAWLLFGLGLIAVARVGRRIA